MGFLLLIKTIIGIKDELLLGPQRKISWVLKIHISWLDSLEFILQLKINLFFYCWWYILYCIWNRVCNLLYNNDYASNKQ